MNNKKKYRIKSRLRFTAFVVVMMLAILTSANGILGIYDAASLTKIEYKTVSIENGDTLWEIASEYMPDTEIRRAVHKLCTINDLESAQIYPGQIIKVPMYLAQEG
ncbi:MAG: LysM peptidoglycan-binding domain-containing protein [Eubacteriales bacterium]|nr:LysM peptidoglycan-binding domain-containing protein [Eubacteriales bacterium]MDD4389439.1 LysM peptidoglycan-binding domain-containing protein [Eubacteriales bacterium]